jgi:hypothetical protein
VQAIFIFIKPEGIRAAVVINDAFPVIGKMMANLAFGWIWKSR